MYDFESKSIRILSKILLAYCLVWAAFLERRILFEMPRFEKIFQDFGVTLPKMTLLMFSPWFRWVIPGIALLAVLKEWLPNRAHTLILNGVFLVALLAIRELYFEGLFGPLGALIRTISGGS
jgi:hypothetical protein